MSDDYRTIFDWGRKHGWFVSTEQARELLEALRSEGGVETREIVADSFVPATRNGVDYDRRLVRHLTRHLWTSALEQSEVPIELPQVTTKPLEGWSDRDVIGTKVTVTLKVRRLE